MPLLDCWADAECIAVDPRQEVNIAHKHRDGRNPRATEFIIPLLAEIDRLLNEYTDAGVAKILNQRGLA
jgi:hypothetical protein